MRRRAEDCKEDGGGSDREEGEEIDEGVIQAEGEQEGAGQGLAKCARGCGVRGRGGDGECHRPNSQIQNPHPVAKSARRVGHPQTLLGRGGGWRWGWGFGGDFGASTGLIFTVARICSRRLKTLSRSTCLIEAIFGGVRW